MRDRNMLQPVLPEWREGSKVVFGRNQLAFIPLPANFVNGMVETKWYLTFWQRVQVLFSGSIYITIRTYGQPLQPLRPTVGRDRVLGGEETPNLWERWIAWYHGLTDVTP